MKFIHKTSKSGQLSSLFDEETKDWTFTDQHEILQSKHGIWECLNRFVRTLSTFYTSEEYIL